MIKPYFQRLARWMTAWAWQKEIAVCDSIAKLRRLDMSPGSMEMEIKQDPALAQWVATCFASMVADSPNYTEMQFDLCGKYADKLEWMTVTVQKGSGKTPHKLRLEAERERDELRAMFSAGAASDSDHHNAVMVEVNKLVAVVDGFKPINHVGFPSQCPTNKKIYDSILKLKDLTNSEACPVTKENT